MGQLRPGSTADTNTDAMNTHLSGRCQFLRVVGLVLLVLSLVVSLGPRPVQATRPGRDLWLPSCPGTVSAGTLMLSPVDNVLYFMYSFSLWQSADAGVSWRRIYRPPGGRSGHLYALTIAAPSVNTDAALYLRYGYGTLPAPVYGLVRSTDGGNSWQERTGCGPNCWGVFPSNRPETIFAGLVEPAVLVYLGRGVLRSDDGGLTWQLLWDVSGVPGLFISPAFADDQTVFAATWSWQVRPPFWLMASTDGGRTWAPRENGLLDSPVGGVVFSPDFARDRVLFAHTPDRVFRSTDAGLNWEAVFGPGFETSITDVILSPDYVTDHTLFLTTYDWVLVSYDDGRNWQVLLNGDSEYRLVVGRSPASQQPEANLDHRTLSEQPTPGNLPTGARQYLPMTGTFGIRPRALQLFLSSTDWTRMTYFRSDDGGQTWRCLNPPPQTR